MKLRFICAMITACSLNVSRMLYLTFFAGNRKCEIREFFSGEELIAAWSEKKADAVFLDIDMPEMTGFDVAEKLRENNNLLIIFVTSHEDKVHRSWTYAPFWFVRKSHLSDLDVVLSKMTEKIDFENEKTVLQNSRQRQTLLKLI